MVHFSLLDEANLILAGKAAHLPVGESLPAGITSDVWLSNQCIEAVYREATR